MSVHRSAAVDPGRGLTRTPPRRLRVAHVTATFPPYLGGTGTVCYYNAVELARRGHQVHILTTARPLEGYQDPPELTVHRLRPVVSIGNAPLLPGLVRLLKGFDLVHLHYPFYFGAELVALACWQRGIPYLITYHQDVELLGWMKPLPWLHRKLLGGRLLTGARKLLFTSLDYGRSSHYAHLLAGGGDRCGELPNGVDTRRFPPRANALGERGPALLFVGSLDRAHYFKGIPVLLEAVQRLARPDLRLVIVGDGDLRPSYEQRAAELGIAAMTQFRGRVSDADLPAAYAGADVVVLPSVTRGEAFGVVLLEAGATGVPVVASNLPGVRSVVDHGVTGLLAEPGDATDLAAKLETLCADPDLRARMGQAGRRRVAERYEWSAIAERLEAVYYEVLGGAVAPVNAGA